MANPLPVAKQIEVLELIAGLERFLRPACSQRRRLLHVVAVEQPDQRLQNFGAPLRLPERDA